LKRNIESGLRKSLARGTDLVRNTGSRARSRDRSKVRISDVGKLSGVTNQLEVSTLLLRGHGKLVPDVHPVTILTVNTLTTNLNLNLSDKLLTDEIQPSSIEGQRLVDLRESDLEVCAVAKITISGDCAGNTATKVSLSLECLLNRFKSEVSVTAIGNLPEGNLRSSSKENVLCAIGD